MAKSTRAFLQFSPAPEKKEKGKELWKGLSAVLMTGDQIWVANDESVSLERLSLHGNEGVDPVYAKHKQYPLSDYLTLPAPALDDGGEVVEADIEGLDHRDGWLWLIGSHSLKRSKTSKEKSPERNIKRLSKVISEGNRYLLARIPLFKEGEEYELRKAVVKDGIESNAARLAGSSAQNDLTRSLSGDRHLQPFLSIPSKDNGFDIEGIAVGENERIFVGLRGPVLRGWAVILEMQLEISAVDPSELKMQRINAADPTQPFYRKHFLDLGGLGVRDLCADGNDLLILAGPTMNLDGPVTIFRWIGGMMSSEESLVWPNSTSLEKLIDLPFGQGNDHAEGMGVFTRKDGKIHSLIVVYDAACEDRQKGPCTLIADIIELPKKF